MRTRLVHGLAAVATVVLAAACSHNYPQQPQDPINANPKPQTPITNPEPQQPGPGLSMANEPQKPINDPSVQKPALNDPTVQSAVNDPSPQKPFYGPGLVAPEDQKAAQQKSKTQPLASDGEVLKFAMAVNEGELQMAELAKKQAQSKDVKSFAGFLASQHQSDMAKIRSLQGKTKIELKPNDLTTDLKGQADQALATLRDKSGKDFDRYYVDSQVRMHKQVLDALDNRVLPAVQNGQVKTEMNGMRRDISDHLAKAEELQKKIDPSLAQARDTSDEKTSTTTTTSGTVNAKSDANKAKQDTKKAAKDTKNSAKDAAKDAKDSAKDSAHDAKEDMKH